MKLCPILEKPVNFVLKVDIHPACFLFLFALQKEWLCLNCQTQRATSCQPGDVPPPAGVASPKKQHSATVPAPSSTPAPTAVDSTPVVEAADLTPTVPEAKVEPAPDTPTPALHSPDPPHPTPQLQTPEPRLPTIAPAPLETPDVIECAELLGQPKSQSEGSKLESKSESSSEIPMEKQQSSSEATVPEQFESEPVDANQQTQDATAAEISNVKQQIGCEEEVEKQPCLEAESSDVKQQEQSHSVTNSLVGQQEESHSEKLLPDVESEPPNATTDTDLGPAKTGIEPKTEAVVFPTDNVIVDPGLDQTENSIELKQNLSPDMGLQELPAGLDPKPDTAATLEKEQTVAEVEAGSSNQSLEAEKSKSVAVEETKQDSEDTAVASGQVNLLGESDALKVSAPAVEGEVADVKEGSLEEKILKQEIVQSAVPPPAEVVGDKVSLSDSEVKLQPEEAVQFDQCESSSTASEICDLSSSPPTAPAEKPPASQTVDKSVPEQTDQHGITEHEMQIEKAPTACKVPQQEIHHRVPDVETSATMSGDEEKDAIKKTSEEEIIEESTVKEAAVENESSNNNAFDKDKVENDRTAESAAEGLEADKEKALAIGETKEKTAAMANDQKPPEEEEEVKRVESGLKPSAETEEIGHEKEKKQSEKTKEVASAVAGEIPKDETQIPETVAEKAQSDISGEADTKEGAGQKEEQQSSAVEPCRAGDESEKSAATSEEKVSGRELTASGQMVSVGFAQETGCLQETAPVPEIADVKKKETVADHSQRDHEEEREVTAGGVEKVQKVEPQPVNSQIQTPLSSSAESNAVRAAATTDAQVDVSPDSRVDGGRSEAADGNKSVSVTEPPVVVAELPQVPVPSTQEKDLLEENKQSPQPSDGGVEVDEVTSANSVVLLNHKVHVLLHLIVCIIIMCKCVRLCACLCVNLLLLNLKR